MQGKTITWGMLLLVAVWLAGATADAEQLAFPTAEGFGRFAKGGRGGKAYLINSLSNAFGSGGSCNAGGCSGGEITLRDCLGDRFGVGARTCIFRVGGRIDWPCQSNVGVPGCSVTLPYLTIAGQTAPGDGIMLSSFELEMRDTHDVIIRYLRVRDGYNVPTWSSAGGMENFGPTTTTHDIIWDHYSTGWAQDDTLVIYGANNITYQWGILSEGGGTNGSDPSKCFILVSPEPNGHVSVLHSLWANYHYRCPNVGSGAMQFVNNVVYNINGYGHIIPHDNYGGGSHSEFVNNYFKPGPGSIDGGTSISLDGCGFNDGTCSTCTCGYASSTAIYYSGNLHTTLRPTLNNPESAMFVQRGTTPITISPTGFGFPVIPSLTSATQAVTDVLAKAGARVPIRDSIDQRAINDFTNGTGVMDICVIGACEAVVGGYPTYTSGTPYPDTDGDGMADAWELAHGLNPNNPADGPQIAANGYSNLENFLNELAGDLAQGNLSLPAPQNVRFVRPIP